MRIIKIKKLTFDCFTNYAISINVPIKKFLVENERIRIFWLNLLEFLFLLE